MDNELEPVYLVPTQDSGELRTTRGQCILLTIDSEKSE